MTKEQIYRHLHLMFCWLNELAERKEPIQKQELEQFFHPNLKIYTNEDLPLSGIDSFFKHIQIALSHYAHCFTKLPFKDCIIDQNKAATYYSIHSLTHKEESFSLLVMSIFEFADEKILNWWEVVTDITS